jgi:hypothetical protein
MPLTTTIAYELVEEKVTSKVESVKKAEVERNPTERIDLLDDML